MSDTTTYTVETAKSGRSKCKKCKEAIAAGSLRIGTQYDAANGMHMSSWCHPACFNLPRKYATGASKISPAEFVRDILQDTSSDGSILPARADELAQAIAAKGGAAGSGAKEDGEGDPSHATIAKIKKEYEQTVSSSKEDGEKPPSKKAKSNHTTLLEAYGEYHKQTAEKLKTVLRWNKQVQTGNKDFLLLKVLDGCVHGRLARCKLCDGGRLKLLEDGETVVCGGTFDEDLNRRIECSYRAKADEAPRWTPWYKTEPTKEQDEEMEKLIEAAKGEGSAVDESDKDVARLIKAASKKIKKWNLSSKDGVRAAAKDLIGVLQEEEASGKTVDLPADEADAMRKVGPLLLREKSLSVAEMIPVIIKEFGFVQDKKEKAAKKEAAIEGLVKNARNAPVIAAFRELGDLYFKEGNRNAGSSCNKVVKALSDLDYEITEDNAMGLCKGKTKVANIGKASAEKIYEFLTTGQIEKLAQKKLEAA